MWPALIGAAATLVAGKMGQDAADDRAREANEMAMDQANNFVQRRVADAKAAGIHPLYALSGGSSSFSPSVAHVFDQSQNIGRAAQSVADAFEKKMAANALEMSASQLEESDLRKDLLYSQIWRNYLEAQPTMPAAIRPGTVYGQEGSMPAGFVGLEPFTSGSPRERGAHLGGSAGQGRAASSVGPHDFNFDASKVGTAREFDPAVSAGPPRPFFEEYRIGSRQYNPMEGEHGADRGLYLLLPAGGNASEAVEALSEGGGKSPMAAMIYAVNAQRYGVDYMRELGQMLKRSDERIINFFRGLGASEFGSRHSPARNDPGIGRYR